MKPNPMVAKMADLLAGDPRIGLGLYLAASEIVDDYEDWGPVLQANERGEYDGQTAIFRLQAIRNEILRRLGS